MSASGIELETARRFLAEQLPAGEPVEIVDDDVLDAAAAVIARSP
jgi:hypothetical protein